jgi:predicted PurR-regulated permease PerM
MKISNLFKVENNIESKPHNLVLLILSCIVFAIWFAVLMPFLSVLAWSLALSIVSFPLFEKIQNRFENRSVASALAVGLLAIIIVAPLYIVFRELVYAGVDNLEFLRQSFTNNGGMDGIINNFLPGKVGRWLSRDLGLRQSLSDAATWIVAQAPLLLSTSIWSLIQIVLIFFTTFFFFRDKDVILDSIRDNLPLTTPESKRVFKDVNNTIYATVYGNILTSLIQGALGGIMFWLLDIPAAVLWGFVMVILSLIPTAGAFIVWAPAALFLMLHGEWGKGTILAIWGTFAIGLIDNVLYPVLVGARVHLHTLSLFFSILGGVIFFGAAGIILGPIALALGQSLLRIWKNRTAYT